MISVRETRPTGVILIALAITLLLSPPALAADDYTIPVRSGVAVTYTVTPVMDASPRRLDVSVTFAVEGSASVVRLQMPVWSPGDYHVQNHAKFVLGVVAMGDRAGTVSTLPVTHPDDNTWDIGITGAMKVTVSYSLPQVPPGIFSDNILLQDHFGFVNGPAALMYLVDHKDLPSKLSVLPPSSWSTAVPLNPATSDPSLHSYLAPDYDTLADSPIVFGDASGLKQYTFKQDGTDFAVVCFRDPENIKTPNEFVDELKKIAHTESALMGGMPTTHYSFVFDVDGFSAGLEHLNSFRIGLPSFVPLNRLSAFIGHEFFHQWNVKRIRPAVLGPFDYIHPPRTHNLWFAEGVTEYYAQMCSYRAGFVSAESLETHFSRQIAQLLRTPARKTVTAEEASMRVWEGGTSDGFGGLSYYDKGELIGLCLDWKIRAVTDGKRSLDDVMRLLMKRHAPPLPGYGEDELRLTVNEVAGQDLSDLYNKIVRSTDELPIEELAAPFGLTAVLKPVQAETPDERRLRTGWLEGTSH